MAWSGEQLSLKLADYAGEPGSHCAEPAKEAARAWRELQRGSQRSLEHQLTARVVQPVADYLGEIEGIKRLHAERGKRLMDYDYYKRKVAELHARGAPQGKDADKLARNTEKLRRCEGTYQTLTAELKARQGALLSERWDFINAPQLLTTGPSDAWP